MRDVPEYATLNTERILFTLQVSPIRLWPGIVHKYWDLIVGAYSSGRSTKENDECIPFSGIVEDIQSFTTDNYFADIWKSCFVWHLCWATQQQANEIQGIMPRRASEYRAPSWSWLSIDGNIDILVSYDSVMSMVEILHVDIKNTSENRFSSTKSGHILGCGILKPVRWGYKSGNIEKHLLLDGQSIRLCDFWDQACPQVMMDIGVDEPCSDPLVDETMSTDGLERFKLTGSVVMTF